MNKGVSQGRALVAPRVGARHARPEMAADVVRNAMSVLHSRSTIAPEMLSYPWCPSGMPFKTGWSLMGILLVAL